MSILEATEQQKQGYLARLPKSQVWGDLVLAGKITNPEKILSLKDYPLDENDILIVSYPKSGTSWTSELVSAITYEGDIESMNDLSLESRVRLIEFDDEHLPENSPWRHANAPLTTGKKRVLFTHLYAEYLPKAAKEGKCKVIYIARNPKDTAVSFFHFHYMCKNLGFQTGLKWDDYFPLFCSGSLAMGSWFKHVISGWNLCKNNPNAKFIKFEDMKMNLMKEIVDLEQFLGLPLSEENRRKVVDHCSFGSMMKNKACNRAELDWYDHKISPFMRKGIVGDWKNCFTVAQNEAFDQLYKDKMEGTGLEFVFE